MEQGERLAAYAAGDLDTAAAAAVEVDLARDAGLRAQLAAIRDADQALADLGEIEIPAGFSAQLRSAVAAEVADAPLDELAARRAAPAWTRRLAAAAAGVAVLAVIGIGVSQFTGGQDDAATASGAGERTAFSESGLAQGTTTAIEITDTDYDPASIQALPQERRSGWTGLVQRLLDRQSPEDTQRELGFALGLDLSAPASLEAAPSGDAPEGASSASTTGGNTDPGVAATSDALQDAEASAFADVRRCLPQLLEGARGPAIPVHAEVAKFEGEPAIVYVLAVDGGDGNYDRLEVFVVAREDCLTRFFAQYKG